jgi:hypothetical protein
MIDNPEPMFPQFPERTFVSNGWWIDTIKKLSSELRSQKR